MLSGKEEDFKGFRLELSKANMKHPEKEMLTKYIT